MELTTFKQTRGRPFLPARRSRFELPEHTFGAVRFLDTMMTATLLFPACRSIKKKMVNVQLDYARHLWLAPGVWSRQDRTFAVVERRFLEIICWRVPDWLIPVLRPRD